MRCKDCVAKCSGAGKEGVATVCSYYKPGTRTKRKILEIVCCGECPYYNMVKNCCGKGAVVSAKKFFTDCPLKEE